MRGGLRWPYRPLQVTCVLVAVLLTAAFSLKLSLAEYAEDQAIPKLAIAKADSLVGRLLGSLGERSLGQRLNAKTIADIFGNPKAVAKAIAKADARTIAYDLSDAADAGGYFRPLPLVDKDGGTRGVCSGAVRQAGERGGTRSAVSGLSQSASA
jgi:hypothetical protein